MAEPRASIVIPCRDLGAFLDEAVESALAQTCSELEILVVDDGSTEPETVARLARYTPPRTRVLRQPARGVAVARNEAIRVARGDVILPLDADDRIAPSYVERALQVFEAQPEVGIVTCEAVLFGERAGRFELESFAMPGFLLRNCLAPASFFRRADFARTRGYDARLPGWEDYDLWLSLVALGRRVVRLPETLLHYRWRADSRDRRLSRRDFRRIYWRLLRNHPALYARHPATLARQLWRAASKWRA